MLRRHNTFANRPEPGARTPAAASGAAGVRAAFARQAARIPKLTENPFFFALLILTTISISKAHNFIGPLRVARPAVLLVMFAGGYAMLRPDVLEIKNLSRTWIAKVFVSLAVLACLSILFGISIGRAGKFFIEDYWKTLLFAYLLLVGLRYAFELYRLIWSYVIAVGLLAWLSLFVFGISKTQGSYGYDANDVGLIMITGLPLALLTFQASTSKLGKLLSLLVLVFAAQTIAASESRGAFVGLVCVGGGLLLFVRSISVVKRVAFIAAVAGALVVAAPPGYWELIRSLQNPQEDYNWSADNGRKQLIKRGFEYMVAYPLFGIGINNFPMAEATISSKAKNHVAGTGLRWAAAHNSYIQMGAELGIPGMVIWLTLLFRGMFSCILLSRKLPRRWARGSPDQRCLYYASMYLPVSVLGFAVTSFFVSFAYMEPIYVLAAMMAGLMIFSKRMLAEEKAQSPAAPGRPRNGRMSNPPTPRLAYQR